MSKKQVGFEDFITFLPIDVNPIQKAKPSAVSGEKLLEYIYTFFFAFLLRLFFFSKLQVHPPTKVF